MSIYIHDLKRWEGSRYLEDRFDGGAATKVRLKDIEPQNFSAGERRRC